METAQFSLDISPCMEHLPPLSGVRQLTPPACACALLSVLSLKPHRQVGPSCSNELCSPGATLGWVCPRCARSLQQSVTEAFSQNEENPKTHTHPLTSCLVLYMHRRLNTILRHHEIRISARGLLHPRREELDPRKRRRRERPARDRHVVHRGERERGERELF